MKKLVPIVPTEQMLWKGWHSNGRGWNYRDDLGLDDLARAYTAMVQHYSGATISDEVKLSEKDLKLCRDAWNAAHTSQSGDRFAPDVIALVQLVNRLVEGQVRTEVKRPTPDQIERSHILVGSFGYSISSEVCSCCNEYFLVNTMSGCDCICGHTETF